MTGDTATQDRVGFPTGWLWLLRIGCTAAGFGLSFAVRPVLHWLITLFSSAPGPLRVAGALPTPVLVPILTVLGAGVGYWLGETARREALTVTVADDGLYTERNGAEQFIRRIEIGSLFTDGKDLVVLDEPGRQLFRAPAADLPAGLLAGKLRARGYPHLGNADPHEDAYQRWVDGHPDVDDASNAMLRARKQALESDEHAEAERLRKGLQDRGLLVRDRNKTQQYRRLEPGTVA